LWIAANDANTSYVTIAAQMILGGGGLGLITAPATEAIMGAVPTAKAGVGSAVNDATRLFGAALGVAVTGSVAASLYSSRLDQTLPPRPPARAGNPARGLGRRRPARSPQSPTRRVGRPRPPPHRSRARRLRPHPPRPLSDSRRGGPGRRPHGRGPPPPPTRRT